MKTNERIPQIDTLRGIASLAVCWFHLVENTQGALLISGKYGWLGVQVFFVISGFIIPYSLLRSNYGFRDYGRFIVRRLVRLDPPYLASVLLVFAIAYGFALRPGFQGEWPHFSFWRVVLHVGYLPPFFGYEWLNAVYWTLLVEFQYYLLVGIAIVFLMHEKIVIRLLTLCVLYLSSWIPTPPFPAAQNTNWPNTEILFYWLPVFLLGILVFQYRAKYLSTRAFYLLTVVTSAGIYMRNRSLLITVTSLIAALAICYWHYAPSVLLWFGRISYSLYLTHLPIRNKTISLLERFTALSPLSIRVFTLALCLVVAYLFYLTIERSAQGWARRVN